MNTRDCFRVTGEQRVRRPAGCDVEPPQGVECAIEATTSQADITVCGRARGDVLIAVALIGTDTTFAAKMVDEVWKFQ